MKDERLKFNVMCSRCGSVLIENGLLEECEHNTIENLKDFYIYLDKKLNKKYKKPIFYSRKKKTI